MADKYHFQQSTLEQELECCPSVRNFKLLVSNHQSHSVYKSSLLLSMREVPLCKRYCKDEIVWDSRICPRGHSLSDCRPLPPHEEQQ